MWFVLPILSVLSFYFYCQKSWMVNLCPWYISSYIPSLNLSQMQNWPPATSVILDSKVPSLNSHHFTNINPYHTCSQLLSTHLLPPETMKYPGTYILLVLFVYWLSILYSYFSVSLSEHLSAFKILAITSTGLLTQIQSQIFNGLLMESTACNVTGIVLRLGFW